MQTESDDIVIRVEGLWKRYGLPLPDVYYKTKRWLHALRNGRSPAPQPPCSPAPEDGPWALRDINLEVRRGETLGIIGRNGAGKSTLLKVLAGVTPPTRGSVDVRGRIFPMIELNAGIHKELTGRENIYLLGAVMGLSRQEMDAKVPEIEEFTELGEWLDKPVRMYSSGMLARLGFGVAVNVDSDILLIDEVLAVGDLAFKRKCYARFERLRNAGGTMLYVSHNMRQVERICDRVVFLEEGEIIREGNPDDVCSLYYQMSSKAENRSAETLLPDSARWDASGDIEIKKVEVLDRDGLEVESVKPFEPIRIRVTYRARTQIENPGIGVHILTSDMIRLSATSVGYNYEEDICLVGGGWFEVSMPVLNLLPGTFSISLSMKTANGARIFTGDSLAAFSVEYSPKTKFSYGLIYIDANWQFSDGTTLTRVAQGRSEG